jgi:hypothetical protein
MHSRTNRRIWRPINTRPHSGSPRVAAESVSPCPARIFAAPRPAFPKPCTQPLTPCPSNRYSEKIEFHVSYRKQSTLTFSNRYIHRGSFAAGFLINPRFPLEFSSEINRHTHAFRISRKSLIQKEKTFSSRNRNGIFVNACEGLYGSRITNHESQITDHGPRTTSHCVSNGHARPTLCVRIVEPARIVGVSGVLPGAVCYE